MEDFEAPRYIDFTEPSPQVSVDDYFNRVHMKHEHRSKMLYSDSSEVLISKTNKLPLGNSNENILKSTPVRKMASKGSKNYRKNVEETTTYESVLSEAMNNLELALKNDKSFNKSCLMDASTFKTPNRRVTRSMCAKIINTPCQKIHESHVAPGDEQFVMKKKGNLKNDENKENEENIDSGKEIVDNQSKKNSQKNFEAHTTGIDRKISHEKSNTESELQSLPNENKLLDKMKQKHLTNDNFNGSEQLPKSRVVTTFTSKSNDGEKNGSIAKAKFLTGNARHRQEKRRISILNQRRLSIAKLRAPAPEDIEIETNVLHVSTAEALQKSQCTKPQSFSATRVKSTRTEQLRAMSLKLKKAHSPTLMNQNRNRFVTVLNREEKEKLEMEKMRQNQFKANALRKDIFTRPAPIKKVAKKMVITSQPFQFTKPKEEQKPPLKSSQEIKRTNSFTKKTVPSIVQDENGIIVKDEEVLGFGIPIEPCKVKKKNTKIEPFSFEARNKALAMKKQERLRKMQEVEQTRNKVEFHARPVPTVVKPPIKKDSEKPTKITLSRSVSFEHKLKQIQQKKDEKIKQILEAERKARIFKAQKAPEFKPVLVRGRSRDNFKKPIYNLMSKSIVPSDRNKKPNSFTKKSQESLITQQKNCIKSPLSHSSLMSKKIPPSSTTTKNKENKIQGTVPKIMAPKCKLSQKSVKVLSELDTQKQVKERKR